MAARYIPHDRFLSQPARPRGRCGRLNSVRASVLTVRAGPRYIQQSATSWLRLVHRAPPGAFPHYPPEPARLLTTRHGPGETAANPYSQSWINQPATDLRGMLGMSIRLRFAGGLLALGSGAFVLAATTPSAAAAPNRRVVQQVHATDQNASTGCGSSRTQNVRQARNYRVAVR